MEQIGYHHFYTCLGGPMAKPGSGARSSVMAIFYFDTDLGSLFPYINAVAKEAELYKEPYFIRFKLDHVFCVLYPERCIASPFTDRNEAKRFRDKMMVYLNSILNRKDKIRPKYKIFKKIAVTDIIRLLPRTNCRECGYPSCMAFAAMLSKQLAAPSRCPYIGSPLNEQVTYPVFDANGNPVSSVTLDVDTAAKTGKATALHQMVGEPDTAALEQANASLISALTKREMEVLAELGKGRTNPEISVRLNISSHTVKTHVTNLFNKLGVSDRTQAAVWAVRHKLI